MSIIMGVMTGVIAVTQLSAMTVTAGNERRMSVRMSDLDLTDPSHMARLDVRVRSAVNRVCPLQGRAGLAEHDWRTGCRKIAMTGARTQMEQAFAAARAAKGTALAAR